MGQGEAKSEKEFQSSSVQVDVLESRFPICYSISKPESFKCQKNSRPNFVVFDPVKIKENIGEVSWTVSKVRVWIVKLVQRRNMTAFPLIAYVGRP